MDQIENEEIKEKAKEEFKDSTGTYGRRRLTTAVNQGVATCIA